MFTFFAIVGGLVCFAIALLVLWLLFEIGVGAVAAVSRLRWQLAGIRSEKREPKWRNLLSTFCSYTYDLVGYRNNGNSSTSSTYGVWRGIGDWEIYKK